ncbi:hypothetical protein MRX96_001889 [Rhipicephalus microplus]
MPEEPTVCPVNNGGPVLYLDHALCGWLMLRAVLSLSTKPATRDDAAENADKNSGATNAVALGHAPSVLHAAYIFCNEHVFS